MLDKAKVIQVLLTVEIRGSGTTIEDKVREVQTLWTMDGKKICEIDPVIDARLQELRLP